MELSKDLKSRQEVRELVQAADVAQSRLRELDQAALDRIVHAMAKAGEAHAAELAELACRETGFGNREDKAEKNLFASKTLWEAVKDQKTVGLLREDKEEKIREIGVPVGVIAAITPSTNPTSTVIYKSIIALKSGNAIVFSPHPGAKDCSLLAADYMAQAAEAAGCPKGAISCISLPTADAVEELMKHPKVRLILATGGAAMVRAAYSSGKPAIGVGAGNGPAYLHKSGDIAQAVSHIIRSKTFDNGTVCASEQSVILDQPIAQEAEQELVRQGCRILNKDESSKVADLLFRSNGTMNPQIVGKSASEIEAMAGLSVTDAKVLAARQDGVGEKYPFSSEKLCPVLGLYTAKTEEEALSLACAILEHEGRGHTFSMHASDDAVVRRFAALIPVSRFLVNTPASLGGIGATTGLFPALTLGCGAVGGSASSNNIGPADLINVRRVAWGHKADDRAHTTVTADETVLELLTQKLLEKLL